MFSGNFLTRLSRVVAFVRSGGICAGVGNFRLHYFPLCALTIEYVVEEPRAASEIFGYSFFLSALTIECGIFGSNFFSLCFDYRLTTDPHVGVVNANVCIRRISDRLYHQV